jgi:superfamily II DNA or RNA helicase
VEILQSVRVRGECWRVADARAYEGCTLLTLVNAQASRRVLAPFDDVEPLTRTQRPKYVGIRRWRRVCRALLASANPPGSLRTAAAAQIDLLPHQLAPALALLRGDGCRLLLADDVGLGKTVQAGLVVAELLARQAAERVLVVVPAGVREQWAGEMRARFRLEPVIADAHALRQRSAMLPVGVNPWTTLPLVVASLDYVKRPEVLPAVRAVPWDVVVVDEAHAAVGDSERHAAVTALAMHAPYVLLVTATPHSGDQRAFAALCGLGTIGSPESDPLLVFRRTRGRIRGGRTRHVRTLHIRPTESERLMHAALARYRRAVRAEHGERALALAVLDKRAFSSPWALAESIARRLAALQTGPADWPRQLTLPLEGAGESSDEDAPPPWPSDVALADPRLERALLEAVRSTASDAAGGADSKLRALWRLLRRINESVLLFTEYRDTAMHLLRSMPRPALLLHGGMDRRTRSQAVDAFHRRPGAILIATDAAGQGLNLHHGCRLVVNVELPWNPMRLEQRIGRVDRIGQSRTVHAIHLVARSTGESRILARLHARVASARTAIAVADPITGSDAVAPDAVPAGLVAPDLERDSLMEVERLESARRFGASDDSAAGRASAGGFHTRPLLARARRRHLRATLAGRTLAIYRIISTDARGQMLESQLVGALAAPPARPDLSERIPASILDRLRPQVASGSRAFWACRLARERAIAAADDAIDQALFQPALFDRRAERAIETGNASATQTRDARRERLAACERRAQGDQPMVELLLVLLPR